MENFFYYGNFHADLDSLIDDEMYVSDDGFFDLDEDWSIECEHSTEQKIVKEFSVEFVSDAIVDKIESWHEDRLPEDATEAIKSIRFAIYNAMDWDKLDKLMPSLYYPNGDMFTITKQDLLNHIA